jgi:hypothetical protein
MFTDCPSSDATRVDFQVDGRHQLATRVDFQVGACWTSQVGRNTRRLPSRRPPVVLNLGATRNLKNLQVRSSGFYRSGFPKNLPITRRPPGRRPPPTRNAASTTPQAGASAAGRRQRRRSAPGISESQKIATPHRRRRRPAPAPQVGARNFRVPENSQR